MKVVTTVRPAEANHIVWPGVDYLGFTSFTVCVSIYISLRFHIDNGTKTIRKIQKRLVLETHYKRSSN